MFTVGVVAIETMGGPKLKFSYGRVDEMDPSAVTPDGRLPNADVGDGPGPKERDHLRKIFGRMGFKDQEIVALSGAHALGRCHADASGYVGPWSGTPTLFNNSYFVLLKGLKWAPNDEAAKFQYKDPSGEFLFIFVRAIRLTSCFVYRVAHDVTFGHRVDRGCQVQEVR